jgi:hypothetical protein
MKVGTVVTPATAYINVEQAKVHITAKRGAGINLDKNPGEIRPKKLVAFNITS